MTQPTMHDVNVALEELEEAMNITDDQKMLDKLTAIYASAYMFKLHLLAKENPHVGR